MSIKLTERKPSLSESEASRTIVFFKLGNRYYHGTNAKGHILTAWCLAGAKILSPWSQSDIQKIELLLDKKGRGYQKVQLEITIQAND